MPEGLVLGIIQGITEWLPVSSEGITVLVKTNFFKDTQTVTEIIKFSLFLHLGTFLAALVYFRKEVWQLTKGLFNYKNTHLVNQKILQFILVSTVISAVLGFLFLKLISNVEEKFLITGKSINLIIGGLLLITAFLQLKIKKTSLKKFSDLKFLDGVILGLVQGFAVFPGLSRSGLTVSALLLRKFENTNSLKLSFLISLPIVLLGNILLNLDNLTLTTNTVLGFIFSFVFGILTIHLILKLAAKINFGYFVFIFGLATIAATLI